MSSFGAVPISMDEAGIDFLVSSANKCIEGVPGFAFALVRRDALVATEGSARSLSLDLLGQWKGLERDGQFRFTPPTHALLAFDQALDDLAGESGHREPFLRTLEKRMGIANFGMGTRTRVYQALRTFREGSRAEVRRMGKALLNLTM
jgi:aspartate aminotransferase-like enzyme